MNTEDDAVGNLLNDVGRILAKQEEEFRSGMNFNLFEVLSVEQKELIHSRVIATLLSDDGAHGLGRVPLEVFCKLLRNFSEVDDYLGSSNEPNSGSTVKVSTEKHIGEIDIHYENGGIIDILVEFDNVKIAIENKIGAGDQKHQLYRYANWLKGQGAGKGLLLYLSPDGHDPSLISTKNGYVKSMDDKTYTSLPRYLSVSYDFIRDWLSEILESHSDAAQVKVVDFIRQYKEVIDAMSKTTNEGVCGYLKPGKLAIAEAIANEYPNAKTAAIQKLLAEALHNVSGVDERIASFSCLRSDDKNPVLISSPKIRDLRVAVCLYNNHLCIGLTSSDGDVPKEVCQRLHEKAESEFRNGYNATSLDGANVWWPISVSSVDAITGSFLDADRKTRELKGEIRRWYDFMVSLASEGKLRRRE